MLDLYESLAVKMKCPREMLHILKAIISLDRAPLLLSISDWTEPSAVAVKIHTSLEETEQAIRGLYRDGIILRSKSSIKLRSFYGVVNTLLGEGRLDHLSEGQRAKLQEYYMLSRLQIYDRLSTISNAADRAGKALAARPSRRCSC